MRVAARSSCEAGRLALATDPIGSILQRYSDALIPEARCRAARPCLEGSKSRSRLSEVPAWPVLFFLPRVIGCNSSRWKHQAVQPESTGGFRGRAARGVQVVARGQRGFRIHLHFETRSS